MAFHALRRQRRREGEEGGLHHCVGRPHATDKQERHEARLGEGRATVTKTKSAKPPRCAVVGRATAPRHHQTHHRQVASHVATDGCEWLGGRTRCGATGEAWGARTRWSCQQQSPRRTGACPVVLGRDESVPGPEQPHAQEAKCKVGLQGSPLHAPWQASTRWLPPSANARRRSGEATSSGSSRVSSRSTGGTTWGLVGFERPSTASPSSAISVFTLTQQQSKSLGLLTTLKIGQKRFTNVGCLH